MNLLKAAFAALVFVLLLPVVAIAQEVVMTAPAETSINVGDLLAPWLQLLLAFAAVVIPALATWAAAELRRRTGIAIELAHMQTFQQALTNGAGLLITKAHQMSSNVTIDARHPAIRDAILYVNNSAPDAIKYFGVTPEAIAEKLVAKLGLLNPPTIDGTARMANNVTTTGSGG
jgi:hypothetical protein